MIPWIISHMKINLIRKLFKNSKYSYAICLSPKVVKSLGWREKQKLVVEADVDEEKIIIKDWKPKPKKQ